jgi:predicted nucleic acid-binding protein
MDNKILIDTDVLIDFLRGDKRTVELIKEISMQKLLTTDINAFELYHGAYKSRNRSANISDVENLLGSLEVLGTARESMKKAAELIAHLENKGGSVDIADLFIASICLVNSASLLTRNKKHFERMGVRIFEWHD